MMLLLRIHLIRLKESRMSQKQRVFIVPTREVIIVKTNEQEIERGMPFIGLEIDEECFQGLLESADIFDEYCKIINSIQTFKGTFLQSECKYDSTVGEVVVITKETTLAQDHLESFKNWYEEMIKSGYDIHVESEDFYFSRK